MTTTLNSQNIVPCSVCGGRLMLSFAIFAPDVVSEDEAVKSAHHSTHGHGLNYQEVINLVVERAIRRVLAKLLIADLIRKNLLTREEVEAELMLARRNRKLEALGIAA